MVVEHHFSPYLHSPEETIQQYDTSKNGISIEERTHRISVYGENILTHKQTIPGRVKFLNQFKDMMIILLIISAWLAWRLNDLRTTTILLVLVLINARIGYNQEAKAERLLEKLKNMVQSHAKVVIDGKTQEILASQLVPGDILVLNEGDAIPADVRLFEERNLQTNDFSLTWESNPKRKHVHTIQSEVELGDRTNMCFMGTTVATGNGLWVVVGTGMGTELGKIATLSTELSTELSPLQKEMNHTAKSLTITTIVVGVSLFVIALLLDREIQTALLFAIWIAASMVPQWLPAQISIALASSAGVLAKKNALVKKLSAVETLGAVNVICTDKTWTLTTNQMTVQRIWYNNKEYTVTWDGYQPEGEIVDENDTPVVDTSIFALFFSVGVLASNAHLRPADDTHPHRWIIWDPTEWALLTLAGKIGITEEVYTNRYALVQEFSFDSSRKRMSVVRQSENGTCRVYVKWSLQTVLPLCDHILLDDKVHSLDDAMKKTVTERDDGQAVQAMRDLSYAYKDIPDRQEGMTMEDAESWLTFLGMVSMMDPPRETVPTAIAGAKEAHIKIIVITWDYALTAKAIGKKVGLCSEDGEIAVFSGQEIRKMSDISISTHLKRESSLIFSRVSPEDKVRIVNLCKKLWWIVAVTGDGVNDAPALKQADIGVAMGNTWTDVAKEAAEIILLDDSFATLVDAIRQGRIIYQNITKNVLSCITTNWSELFAVLLWLGWSLLWGFQMAIGAVQILAIDLIWEMWPLAALSQDPASSWIMQQPARNTKHHMIHRNSMKDMVLSWLVMGLCSYAWFYLMTWGTATGTVLAQGQATTYLTIVLSQFVNIFARRMEGTDFFTSYLRANKKLIQAMLLSLIMMCCLFYIPFLSSWFRFGPLPVQWRLYALCGAGIYGLWRYRVQGAGKQRFTRKE